jgi:hypothetical protein
MELKDCPFCETEVHYMKGKGICEEWIQCLNCKAMIAYNITKEKSPITVWNTRPIEDSYKPMEEFIMRVAHIITKDGMTDSQKLNCIKIRYRMMAFPEHPINAIEKQLIEDVY